MALTYLTFKFVRSHNVCHYAFNDCRNKDVSKTGELKELMSSIWLSYINEIPPNKCIVGCDDYKISTNFKQI